MSDRKVSLGSRKGALAAPFFMGPRPETGRRPACGVPPLRPLCEQCGSYREKPKPGRACTLLSIAGRTDDRAISRFDKSIRLQQRSHRIIPGGGHTYAKGDDSIPCWRRASSRAARAATCWDVDGNEYIEYGMGNRAVGLGHAYPPVRRGGRRRRCPSGCNFTRPAPIEVDCADTFLDLDRRRRDGEVLQGRLGRDARRRAARPRLHGPRPDRLSARDHPFFSTDDWFIGTTAMNAGIPEAVRRPHGHVPLQRSSPASRRCSRSIPARSPGLILEAARGRRAAGRLPARGCSACATSNGALLIFDEMITGFRWHLAARRRSTASSPISPASARRSATGSRSRRSPASASSCGSAGSTHRPPARLPAVDDAWRRDACAGGGDRHDAGLQNEPVIEHLRRSAATLRTGIAAGRRSATACRTTSRSIGRAGLPALRHARPAAEALAGIPHAVPAGDDPARRADAVARRQLLAWQ